MAPYLKTVKNCDSGTIGDCWTTSYLFFDQPAYAVVASFDPFGGTPESASVLPDGMVLGYYFISQDCANTSKTGVADCAVVTVDIDGAKGKHVSGTDLFALHVKSEGIAPFGVDGDKYTVCSAMNKNGCAAKYLYGQDATAGPVK